MQYSVDIKEAERVVFLFQLLQNEGEVSDLLWSPYNMEYSEISDLIQELEAGGYIIKSESYEITDKGKQYYNYLNDQLKRKGIYRYVSLPPGTVKEALPLDKPFLSRKTIKGKSL